jgi:hypothetical protein
MEVVVSLSRILINAAVAILLISCGPDAEEGQTTTLTAGDLATAEAPRDVFWRHLQALCPRAVEGRLIQAPEGDTQIDPDARLVVHFRECGEEEIRFPLHVDDDRSRTWVFTHHADSLELRHDHRHEDGTEESNTWYGASTVGEGTATRQEFLFESDGMLVGWRVDIVPGQRFTYGTIRDGEWRHHLEFDLTREVATPPPPWGNETRPSQRPVPPGR